MKHFIKTTKYFLLAILVILNFSCTGEDGEQGPQGEPGQDGNANVQTYTFDMSTTNGSSYTDISIAALTQDVVANDAILSYLSDDGNNWTAIPCPPDSYQFDFAVEVNIAENLFTMDYSDSSGSAYTLIAGDLQTLKIVIIESNSTTAGKIANTKQNTINQLIEAGIDIKDYYAVCDYYNIAY